MRSTSRKSSTSRFARNSVSKPISFSTISGRSRRTVGLTIWSLPRSSRVNQIRYPQRGQEVSLADGAILLVSFGLHTGQALGWPVADVEEGVIAMFSMSGLGRLTFDRANRLMAQRGCRGFHRFAL
jgi:hypothetical protein